MPYSLGIIGLGRMAQAVVIPLLKKKDFLPEEIIAVVGKEESINGVLEKLPKGVRVVSAKDPTAEEVWHTPVQVLAVKPQQLNSVESKLVDIDKNIFSNRPLMISLLAGVTLQHLQKSFSKHACVRVVPNAPVLVRSGLTGLVWGESVGDHQRVLVREIFQPISELIELPESQIDAFLGLASSGPAYLALVTEALADGGVAAGLPRKLALHIAKTTLLGTAELLKEKELHPAHLKDMVASPGGTTIAALRHLEKVGLRSSLIEAVVLAAERSREMG